ncbi:MAG TPA: zf-HC2 domain-containing protein, partial [Solirubrobacterales bacterium]|nr:zf-HC2 domain-containing protein [Solirubrobacterales bacterium]
MTTDDHRDWRLSLGAYALGDLPAEERAAIAAHLEGCEECRAELRSLEGVAALLPLADPARIEQPAARPPADLGARIEAQIAAESSRERRAKRRRRFRLGVGGAVAVAAVAAVLAIAILPLGGGENSPAQEVRFASLPKGVSIKATLEPHAFGTEIQMYVSGVRSGTLCRVFLRDEDGHTFSAGSFRYRWGDDSEAELSSALDLSQAAAIGVHAGGRTFVAPVSQATALVSG